jgi:uncharacterized protein (DUF427 family)
MVESNLYFPLESVNLNHLVKSSKTTICPWKGTANYYTLEVNGKTNENAAWYYGNPKPAAPDIKGKVAFWRGVDLSEKR